MLTSNVFQRFFRLMKKQKITFENVSFLVFFFFFKQNLLMYYGYDKTYQRDGMTWNRGFLGPILLKKKKNHSFSAEAYTRLGKQ